MIDIPDDFQPVVNRKEMRQRLRNRSKSFKFDEENLYLRCERTKKVGYQTKQVAKRRARLVSQKSRKKLVIYKCTFCHNFHLTKLENRNHYRLLRHLEVLKEQHCGNPSPEYQAMVIKRLTGS